VRTFGEELATSDSVAACDYSPDMARLSKLSRSIEGRIALVTGAASGMGRATAQLFADEGAVVACVDRSPHVQDVAEEIVAAGGTAASYQCDLSDVEAIHATVATVRVAHGPIDILINNAGVSLGSPIDDRDFETTWAQTFAVNIDAQMHLVRATLDDLKRNGDGRIVNIASTEGLAATTRLAPYTASKHAVVGFTKALAVELGVHGVTANCVCPGPIHTGMTEVIPDENKEIYARRRVPMKRYGNPEEVAHMTLSLVLPASSFVTGAVVAVDGGLSVKSN